MIILAHFDERLGIPYAHLFAQKGFENVFLISGGTDFFIYIFRNWVIHEYIPWIYRRNEGTGRSQTEGGAKQLRKKINCEEK